MFKKLVNVLAMLALCAAAFTAFMFWSAQPDREMKPVDSTGSGQIAAVAPQPQDLSGNWVSRESVAGTKFTATIEKNTVYIEMVVADGYSGLWYGTFDILQPGENVMVSKAIYDVNKLVLSSAETKQFIYQDTSLVFDFSVMGTRTTIEMKRA